jgi:hypothetical protein
MRFDNDADLSYIFVSATNIFNQGCKVDKGSKNACSSTNDYNYGWRDPDARFRSILTNDCVIGQCDNMPKNGCPRVQRFSNMHSFYNDRAMGSPEHNNAKQMNEVATIIANYQRSNVQPSHNVQVFF